MSWNKIAAISLITLGSVLSACTRPQGDSSKVNLTIPLFSAKNASQSVSAQSTNLTYVAINIAGGEKPTSFCAWDAERKTTDGPCRFSETSVELDQVDNGNGRIVQVLMVYNEGTGNTMTFKYGDRVVNLPSSENIEINPVAVGGVQAGGHVRGRFLTGADVGPSGLMTLMYPPADGKPAMILQKVEVYSGWFDAFTLESTGLDYVLNGVNLFNGPMNKAKFVSRASETNYASRVTPAEPGSGEYEVYGFFSPAAANLASKVAQSANCTLATSYSSCFSPNLKFRGPFRTNAVGDFLTITGANPSTIAWTYLPGIDASWFDGVAVYASSVDLATEDLDRIVMSRGFNCEGFSKTVGVQLLGAVSVATGQTLSATLPALPTAKRPIAVCPRRGLFLQTAAAVLPKIDNDGGCADCKYLRLEISSYAESDGDKYRIGKNGCYPISLGAYRGKGTASADHTMPISLALPDPTWGHFYSEVTCSSLAGPITMTIPAGQSSTSGLYWIKATSPGADFELAGAISSDVSNGFIAYQKEYNRIDVLNPITKVVLPSGPILSNTCYEATASVLMPNGWQLPVAPNSVYDNLVGGTDVRFAMDAANCASSVSGTQSQLISSFPTQTFWFKRITAGTVSVVATPTSFDSSFATATAVSSADIGAVKIKLTPVSGITLNQCNEIRVELLNSANQVVPAPQATIVNLQPADQYGYWAMDSSCSSVADNVAIPMQSSGRSVYFYATNVGTLPAFVSTDNGVSLSAPMAISLPGDTTVPWVKVSTRPIFPRGGGTIGSHNFPVTLTLAAHPLATLKCYFGSGAPMADSASWGDCGGRLVGPVLTFQESHLGSSPSETTHILATVGKKSTILSLNKAKLFGQTGFSKTTCDSLVTAGTFDSVMTQLSSHNVVCLEAGLFAQGSGTASGISLASGKMLLGRINHTDGTPATIIQVGPTPGSVGVQMPSLSGTVTISNIKFSMSGVSGLRNGILSNSGSWGSVQTFANVFENTTATGGQTNGISISGLGGITLDSRSDVFIVKSFPSGGISTGVSLTPSGNTTNIQFGKFNVASATSSDGSIAISLASPISGAASYVTIIGTEFSGPGAGVRAVGDNNSGSNALDVTIGKSLFDMSDTNFVAAYPLYFQDNVGLMLSDSKFRNAITGKPVLKYYQAASGGGYSGSSFLNLTHNIFQQFANASILLVGSASYDLTSSRQVVLEGNHFIKMSGGVSASAVQGAASAYGIYFVRNISSPSHGNNLICGVDASNSWTTGYGGSSSIGSGTYPWSPPSVNVGIVGDGICSMLPPPP